MSIDGRTVGKALADRTRVFLRAQGFQKFQGRHAWRLSEFTTDLISFPSMSAYIAEGVGCTTFSFGCNLGVLYRDPSGSDPEWPRDWHLTIRGAVGKSIAQRMFHPWGRDEPTDRPDIWYVAENGRNLDEVVEDAFVSLRDRGLAFIDRARNTDSAIQMLESEEEGLDAFAEVRLFGAGSLGSPKRVHDIALVSSFRR